SEACVRPAPFRFSNAWLVQTQNTCVIELMAKRGPAQGPTPDAGPASDRWDSTPLGPRASWPQPLRTLVELMQGNAQPMFIAWGPEHILLFNEPFAGLLDPSRADAFGRGFFEIWHELADEMKPQVEQVLSGQPVHVPDVVQTMTRDGPQEVHFAYSWTPARDEAGAVAGFFSILVETTALVAAERLRTEGFRRVEHMFEQAPGFIAVLEGPEHIVTLANAAFRKLVGEDRELRGRPFAEALPEAAGEAFVTHLDRV